MIFSQKWAKTVKKLISLRQGGYVETGKSSKIAWNSHVEHPPSAAHTAKTAKSEVYTYNSHISHVVQAAHIPKKLPKVKSTRAALAAHTTKLPKSEIYQKPVAFEYL